MKLRKMFHLFIVLFIFMFTIFTIFVYYMEAKGKESVVEIEKRELQRSVETIVKIKSEALYNIVNEDTLWNDLVDFVKYPDKEWAEENISSIITPNESLVFISVYDKEYRNIFTYYNNLMKERIEFYREDFNKILKEPKPVVTYLKKSNVLYEICMAPINRSEDYRRIGEKFGVLVIGKILDDKYFGLIENLASAQKIESKNKSKGITVDIDYFDWDNRKIASYSFLKNESESEKQMDFFSMLKITNTVLYIAVILAAFLFFKEEYVLKPIGFMEKAANGESIYIDVLKNYSDEFKEMAKVIEKYYENNEEIVKLRNIVESANYDLEERKIKFEKIFESKRIMRMFVDALTFEIKKANKAACDYFGVNQDNTLGKKIYDLLRSDNENIRETFYTAGNTEGGINFINKCKHSIGEDIYQDIFVELMKMEGKEYYYVVINDITNEKKKEKDCRSLMLVKNKLFAVIGHDLRGPFASILGMLEVLSEMNEHMTKEELDISIDEMRKTAREAVYLLENLLEWVGSQGNEIETKFIKLKVKEVFDDAMGLLELAAINKKIEIKQEFNEYLVVNVDQRMIVTILRNLISNAIKYSYNSSVIIIKAEEVDNFIELSVKDFGIGISESRVKSLFNLGEIVVTAGTEGEKGTGLGLVLCRDFVNKMNGTIWAESLIGKGTTIYIRLPKAQRELRI